MVGGEGRAPGLPAEMLSLWDGHSTLARRQRREPGVGSWLWAAWISLCQPVEMAGPSPFAHPFEHPCSM